MVSWADRAASGVDMGILICFAIFGEKIKIDLIFLNLHIDISKKLL